MQGLQPGLVLSPATAVLGRLAPTWPGCVLPNRRVVLRHLCCGETPREGYPVR